MKRILTKLNSKKGETLIGILIAILIIALSAGLFASMYSASMNINKSAREMDEEFYASVSDLEEFVKSGKATEGKPSTGKVKYFTPDTSGNYTEVSGSSVNVDIYTKDGMSVYKKSKSSGGS